jgi:hypothetical protein
LSSVPGAIRPLRFILPSRVNAILSLFDCFEFGSNVVEAAQPCAFRTGHAHSNIIKTKMQSKQIQHYNGYAVQSSAHRLPDGSFSSNLLLERIDSARAEGRYWFYSLDYFKSEEQALQHSTQWARNWVDTRG